MIIKKSITLYINISKYGKNKHVNSLLQPLPQF